MQRIRPRFHLHVEFSPEQVFERFRQRLACEGCPCKLTTLDRHLEVQIHDRLSHFWSPQLSIEVSPGEGGTAELNGLFGPNPNVWTLFLACYAFLILSAIFAGLLGMSQLLVGTGSAWGLWLAAACVAALALPYAGSLVGQRLAADQMEMLRCFLRASLAVQESDDPHPDLCVDEGLVPPPEAKGQPLPVVR